MSNIVRLMYARFVKGEIRFGLGKYEEKPKTFKHISGMGRGLIRKDENGNPRGQWFKTPQEALDYLKQRSLYELEQAEKRVTYHKAIIEAVDKVELEEKQL